MTQRSQTPEPVTTDQSDGGHTCPSWCHRHYAEGPGDSEVYHYGAHVDIESVDSRCGSVRGSIFIEPGRVDRVVSIDDVEFTPAGAREYAAAILRAVEQVEEATV